MRRPSWESLASRYEQRGHARDVVAGARRLVWERHRWIARWVVTLVLLAVIYYAATALIAWLTAPRIDMTMSPLQGPVAVAAEPARAEPIVEKVTYTGSIWPYQEVTVYPRVEGWVQEFGLYEGDQVRRGGIVARLDRAELGAAAAEAKSKVQQVEAEVLQQQANLARTRVEVAKAAEEHAQAEAGLREAQAALVQAKADLTYVEAEFGRDEILIKNAAISHSAFDQRKSQLAVAGAKIAQAEARIRQMQAGIARAAARQDEAQKMVAAAEAALVAARARVAQAQEAFERRIVVLQYTDVSAPITGRVAKRHIYAGILVKPGMPIVDLQDLSKVRVQARVAEQDVAKVRVGMPARVRFTALSNPHNAVEAKVTAVFPQLDPATRTATVELVVPNPDERIKPDMYAVVDLILERRAKAVTIPRLAVDRGPDGQAKVFVTDGVAAMSRPVKLGIASGERVEVLEGVKEGEMVVYRGQRGLSDGQQVNIVAGL